MTLTFSQAIETHRNENKTLICLDWITYGCHLFLQGKALPWQQPSDLVYFLNQGQELFKLDAQLLPLGDYLRCWLADHPEILASMAGKKRVGFALKTLLANNKLRQDLLNLLTTVIQGSRIPVILNLPSVADLLFWAHGKANKLQAINLTSEHLDTANVYLADFLRQYAELKITAMLIEENDVVPAEQDVYGAIANVCHSYDWAFGLYGNQLCGQFNGVDFVVSNQPDIMQLQAIPLADSFWEGHTQETGSFVFGTVPLDKEPEQILQRLEGLKP